MKKLNIRHKGKGHGKKSKTPKDEQSNPEKDNDQNPEILDIKVSKSETEDLCAENNNEAKAGKSARLTKFIAKRRERENTKEQERYAEKTRRKERERAREMEKESVKTSKKADRSKQRIRSSPKQEWIRFFPPEGTPDADGYFSSYNDIEVHKLMLQVSDL